MTNRVVAKAKEVDMDDPRNGIWPPITPWRCRHGYHKWFFVESTNPREVSVSGHPWIFIYDWVEECRRCGLKLTHMKSELPKRIKIK